MDERRKEPRHILSDDVVINIELPSRSAMTTHQTVMSRLLDVSNSGVRLSLGQPAEQGTQAVLWLKRLDRPGTMALTGVVAWCEPSEEDDGFQAGVEISKSESPDAPAWEEMLSEHFTSS
jgi:Tfp pilus assembly protein PilZ